MRVDICGVRGSTAAPGADFVQVGGHTSCVAVSHDDASAPTLVIDAGTGIRRLWELTGGAPFAGSVLLGHLHWDHTQGLPFFRSGDHPESRVDVHVPSQAGRTPVDLLGQAMGPPAFPIGPADLRGAWRFLPLDEGRMEVEGFSVQVREIPHKGGRTFGFRIDDGRGSLAYLSDHHPASLGPGPDGFGPYHEAAVALCEGVDVLLHDAQYTADDWATRAGFGHSTVAYAVGLAEHCRVGELLLYHHDPARTDREVAAIVADARRTAAVPVAAAVEGMTLRLGAAAAASA